MALIVSGSAHADWWKDTYWGFGGGYQFSPDKEVSFTTSKPDKGWIAKAEFGGNVSRAWRNELELSHWSNDITPGPHVGTWIDGDYGVSVLAYNVIWDWNPGHSINPYVGVGAGPAFWTAQGNGAWHIDDSGWALGGNFRAGLDWKIGDGTHLETEYRYSGLMNPKVRTPTGNRIEDFINSSLMIGLRFPLEAAAPPPPPPPPPPPAATTSTLGPFKVYFPWDKSSLTKEARATIDEVAAQVKSKKIQRVHIEGNTDTSGGDAYNQKLSDARSAAVRDALIADGVPASAIDTVGLGETNPAVKTGDSVKEPLNRNASITVTILNN